MAIAAIEHIEVDDKGVAHIKGSRIKVQFIAVERARMGLTPEQIHENHPHLTLAQIYAALAYYYDHQPEVDAQIDEANRLAEEMRKNAPPSPVAKRLRDQGLLP
jgi:uncharacterized protein (DUF433 family)